MRDVPTIFALATPRGRGGVAVFRVSGPRAGEAFEAFGLSLPQPRRASHRRLRVAGEALDDGICLWFPAPASYTGEDVAEFHVHGSVAVAAALAEALSGREGFRMAEPGEFTRRAFLNGKMDLTAAEGVADLIDAETPAQRRQALRLLSGQAAQRFSEWRHAALRALAFYEAVLDFPDEDLPPHVLGEAEREVEALKTSIEKEMQAPPAGERIRDGFVVAILGAPNVGKSTLINQLAQREVAIVSQIPGTTRDLLEAPVNLSGYPLLLTDTAGMRDSDDPLEREGMKRAAARAEQADVTIAVADALRLEETWEAVRPFLRESSLVLINKCDVVPPSIVDSQLIGCQNHQILWVSFHREADIDRMKAELFKILEARYNLASSPVITRVRHRELLKETVHALAQALRPLPLELRCEELRKAGQALGKITGRIDVEEVLGEIFGAFCIGK